jgi:hypothetical protein
VAELVELVFLSASRFGTALGEGCGSQESRVEIKAGITRDIRKSKIEFLKLYLLMSRRWRSQHPSGSESLIYGLMGDLRFAGCGEVPLK